MLLIAILLLFVIVICSFNGVCSLLFYTTFLTISTFKSSDLVLSDLNKRLLVIGGVVDVLSS